MPRESQITFPSSMLLTRPSSCPVCKRYSIKVKLKVTQNDTKLTLLKCRCGSLFYPGAKAPNYEIVENRTSFFMRLDQAESIDSAAMPLFASPDLETLSVVDIGCGLGFTSSFVRFTGRKCFAFDPSSAARLSSEYLKIDVSHEYLSVLTTQTDSTKLVFASEVIEHVDDPLGFLKSLKAIAGDEGYLIITTPNADYVDIKHSENTVLAMLAPSQHLFLLSRTSLSDLATAAGFSWIHSWTHEERLFLIAGPREIKVSNTFSRRDYISYLFTQLKDKSVLESIRYRSYGYRLFKEYIHSGRYLEAEQLFNELTEAYLSLGLDLQNPQAVTAGLLEASHGEVTLPDPEKFPFNLAQLMYLSGIMQIAHFHDRIAAKPFLLAAIAISELYQKVSSIELQIYDVELKNVKQWAIEQINIHSA